MSRRRSGGSPRDLASAASAIAASREELAGGLADDPRLDAGRELEPSDERAGVDRRAVGREPPAVLVHADQLRAVADQAERAIEVVPGRGLGRIADDDGRGAGVGLRRLFVAEEALALELRSGVVRGQDVERLAGEPPGRVRGGDRQRRLEPLGRDRRAHRRAPARERRSAHERGVGHDPERHAAPRQLPDRPGRSLDRLLGEDDHAVEVEQQRADAGEGTVGSGHGQILAIARRILGREVRMGLLDGKKALVFGVANDHSIAWGIARAFHEQGATLGFSSVESLIERRVRPLADCIGSTFVEPCDVQDDAQIAARLRPLEAGARRPRHPRPRPRVREARGPRRALPRHVPRRLRARPRRQRLLARRPRPRRAAAAEARRAAS